jgi:hypothetical protein
VSFLISFLANSTYVISADYGVFAPIIASLLLAPVLCLENASKRTPRIYSWKEWGMMTPLFIVLLLALVTICRLHPYSSSVLTVAIFGPLFLMAFTRYSVQDHSKQPLKRDTKFSIEIGVITAFAILIFALLISIPKSSNRIQVNIKCLSDADCKLLNCENTGGLFCDRDGFPHCSTDKTCSCGNICL